MTKNPNMLMKRQKFAKGDKTQKCSLSTKDNPCYPAVQHIQVGDNDMRNLCQQHLIQWQRGRLDFKPKFEKASILDPNVKDGYEGI